MMLRNVTRDQIIISKLKRANNFFQRAVGLIPRKSLPAEEGLWIPRCRSIHTFFMCFAIDCIFVDKNLQVKALVKNIHPWRVTPIYWSSDSVFELLAGTIQRCHVEIGDQLHVGPAIS